MAMSGFRKGYHSFFCTRCGGRMWSDRMRIDGYTHAIVCDTCYDRKPPLETPRRIRPDGLPVKDTQGQVQYRAVGLALPTTWELMFLNWEEYTANWEDL